jgi:hypothetical protein
MPDLASTINTDFACLQAKDGNDSASACTSPSQGFDFQGWFQHVYVEHHRMVRETTPYSREQRVHSAGDGSYLAPSAGENQRLRSYSHGKIFV